MKYQTFLFVALSLVVAVVNVLLDSMLPLGWGGSALYMIPMFIVALTGQVSLIRITAALAAVLLFMGLLTSPYGVPFEVALLNRTVGAVMIVLFAWIFTRQINSNLRLQLSEKEMRDARGKLMASEERYRSLVENAQVGVFATRLDGTLEYVNDTFAEQFGYDSPQEAMRHRAPELYLNPDEREGLIRRVLAQGRLRNYPLAMVTKQGVIRHMLLSVASHENGLIGMIQDVTALVESEAFGRKVVDSSLNGLYIVDRKRIMPVFINKQYTRLTGYTLDDLQALPGGIFRLFDEDELPTITRNINALDGLADDESQEVEYRLRCKDGRWIWCLSRHAVFSRNPDGTVRQYIGTFLDITERKQAQQVLERDKGTLERLIMERTAELLQAREEMDRARRLADLGELSATVAHELRNPLAAIRVAATNIGRKVAKAGCPGLDVRSNLENIDRKVEDSARIINNMLFYTRLKQPDLEEVSLTDLLEESIDTALSTHPDWDVELQRDYEPMGARSLRADPRQLREMFINILNNAFDALKNKRGRVTIRTALTQQDAVTVSIGDTGQGIPFAIHERVFQPFFTTKSKGTGLGLAVCRQIVDLHGGTISIDSEEGRGTTVTVTLPLAQTRVRAV